MPTPMTFVLAKDKTTKGAVRYGATIDDRPLNIYLSKKQSEQLGDPEEIRLTIESV